MVAVLKLLVALKRAGNNFRLMPYGMLFGLLKTAVLCPVLRSATYLEGPRLADRISREFLTL